MRRVLLLCMFSVAFVAVHAQSQPQSQASGVWGQTWKQPRDVRQKENHAPKGVPSSNLTCGRKIAPNGYQPLPAVPRTDGYLEYAGSLITWAPIGNDTECHIRQLYFTIPDTMVEGPVGSVTGPDILVALYKVNSDTPVKVPISFDIVSFIDGNLYFRIDAQSTKTLKGDYVMRISVIGKAR